MGLILAALAAAIRSRWLVAGMCIGLACCAKQYSLLAAVPLLVAAPRPRALAISARRRWRRGGRAHPLGIAMGKGMVDATLGVYATPKGSPTFVGRLHLHGVALVAVSAGLPLGLAGAAAAWARSRLKSALYQPQPLVALVAVSLALRLVFEVNLFSYYFMATAVALDRARRREWPHAGRDDRMDRRGDGVLPAGIRPARARRGTGSGGRRTAARAVWRSRSPRCRSTDRARTTRAPAERPGQLVPRRHGVLFVARPSGPASGTRAECLRGGIARVGRRDATPIVQPMIIREKSDVDARATVT